MKTYVSIRKMDKTGRIVIPKKIRNKLKINSKSLFKIKLIKDRIIIQVYNKKTLDNWFIFLGKF